MDEVLNGPRGPKVKVHHGPERLYEMTKSELERTDHAEMQNLDSHKTTRK